MIEIIIAIENDGKTDILCLFPDSMCMCHSVSCNLRMTTLNSV